MVLRQIMMGCAVIGVVAACTDSDSIASGNKLHVVEQYCIDYEHSGLGQSGTSRECMRNWGNQQTRWQDLTIGIAGFTQTQSQRTITNGKQVINFDPTTLKGTETENPFYDAMASAAGSDPLQFGQNMIAQMGFTPNGQSENVANETCTVYSGQMGTMCMTADGLLLRSSMGGVNQIATAVDRSSGGNDEDYVVPAGVTITDVPDIGQILQGNFPGQQQP